MKQRRLLLLLGAVGIAALAAVVLIVVASKSGSAAPTTPRPRRQPRAAAPSSSLAGIPQHGDTLGNPNAPATLVVYEDPQCPFCRRWNVETLPTVAARLRAAGAHQAPVYRGVEIIGPNSLPGLRAIYAAGKQNKLWNMADALYARQGAENSGWITTDVIRRGRTRGRSGSRRRSSRQMNKPAVTAALTRRREAGGRRPCSGHADVHRPAAAGAARSRSR